MIIKITLIPHKGISWPNVKILLNNNTLLDQVVTPNNDKFFMIYVLVSTKVKPFYLTGKLFLIYFY